MGPPEFCRTSQGAFSPTTISSCFSLPVKGPPLEALKASPAAPIRFGVSRRLRQAPQTLRRRCCSTRTWGPHPVGGNGARTQGGPLGIARDTLRCGLEKESVSKGHAIWFSDAKDSCRLKGSSTFAFGNLAHGGTQDQDIPRPRSQSKKGIHGWCEKVGVQTRAVAFLL